MASSITNNLEGEETRFFTILHLVLHLFTLQPSRPWSNCTTNAEHAATCARTRSTTGGTSFVRTGPPTKNVSGRGTDPHSGGTERAGWSSTVL